jgi:hypothetical protein
MNEFQANANRDYLAEFDFRRWIYRRGISQIAIIPRMIFSHKHSAANRILARLPKVFPVLADGSLPRSSKQQRRAARSHASTSQL